MDVVDTDVLIDVQRGHPPAVGWFAGLTELPGVPGFVVMELVQDARDTREVRQALKLVAPFSDDASRQDCARTKLEQRKSQGPGRGTDQCQGLSPATFLIRPLPHASSA